MCLIGLAWQQHPQWPLILLANRDEFRQRPTAEAQWWPEGWLGGRDLQAGGSWLALGRDGRLAALTNVRNVADYRPDAPSRGELVTAWLQGQLSSADYLAQLRLRARQYNGFNLLLFDGQQLLAYHSPSDQLQAWGAGTYAVSNAGLDTPWYKSLGLQQGLSAVAQPEDEGALLSLLTDRQLAPDALLPDTGLGLARERTLSARFIEGEAYGTRSSCLLWWSPSQVRFHEYQWPSAEVACFSFVPSRP
ncbi:NRDE family protein [Leeia sp.]|uniref:NRDE family protein n=1 Tax=Leeia sp. TaxID=2884678 RepID=UPI0035B31B9C